MIAVGNTRVKKLPFGNGNTVDYAFVGQQLVHPQMLARCSGTASTYKPATGGYQQVGLCSANCNVHKDSLCDQQGWNVGHFGGWSLFESYTTQINGTLHYRGEIRLVPEYLGGGNVEMAWGILGGLHASPAFAPVDGVTRPTLACSGQWTLYEWSIPVTIQRGSMWSLGISGWAGHLEERNVSLTFSAD